MLGAVERANEDRFWLSSRQKSETAESPRLWKARKKRGWVGREFDFQLGFLAMPIIL